MTPPPVAFLYNPPHHLPIPDLELMRVEYRSNENSTAANDFFIFKLLVGDKIYLEEKFTITVYPESYWDGLQIGSNNTLLGGTS